MQRAQVSSELIAIMGISLLVMLIFFVLSSQAFNDALQRQNYLAARDTVERLAYAAEHAYAQGEGASRTIFVEIPPNANLSSNSSYIGKPGNAPAGSLSRTINLHIGGNDFYATTSMPVIGSFPQSSGKYPMKVTSRGSYVTIYPVIIYVDTPALSVSMLAGEAKQAAITVYGRSGSNISANASKIWAYQDFALSLSQTSFIVNSSGTPIVLTFSSNNSSSGFYGGFLFISATLNGTDETIQVPLNAQVLSIS